MKNIEWNKLKKMKISSFKDKTEKLCWCFYYNDLHKLFFKEKTKRQKKQDYREMEGLVKHLVKIYNKTDEQDRELFLKQLLYFREIMCSKNFSLERKEREFKCLGEAYFRCNLTEGDITLFKATSDEFQRRSEFELFSPQLKQETRDDGK